MMQWDFWSPKKQTKASKMGLEVLGRIGGGYYPDIYMYKIVKNNYLWKGDIAIKCLEIGFLDPEFHIEHRT